MTFIQYLESGFMKFELYSSTGSTALKLGSGMLNLRELLARNKNSNVSSVIMD